LSRRQEVLAVLGIVALIASAVSRVRGAAIVCIVAWLSTATGIIIAAGTSDREALGFYAVFVAVAMIPAAVAVTVLRR
jgi:hypothetical protein